MRNTYQLIIIMFALLLGADATAQVAIGKSTITNPSVLLEFGNEAKGIIVPQVSAATIPAGGTFIFNNSPGILAMTVYENGVWRDLTSDSSTIPKTIGLAHTFSNNGATDITGINGVIIGSDTSTKKGVLVLESTEKALLLPQVSNPHITIEGAIAGTMVFDTASDTLAVYDGVYWSYWK